MSDSNFLSRIYSVFRRSLNIMKRKLGEFDENETLALRAWYEEAKFHQILKRQRLRERTILQKLNEKEDDLNFIRSSSSNEDDDSSASNDECEDLTKNSDNTKICDQGKGENFGNADVAMYLKFLACDRLISKFLKVDYCKKLADNYLLATVFVYFKRCQFVSYSRMKFFQLLYLAIEMEEDEEEVKYDILPWALGNDWRTTFTEFIAEKDELWKKMNFSSMVSWESIQKIADVNIEFPPQVMNVNPEHPIWLRRRPLYHAGAMRSYLSTLNGCCSQGDDSKTRLYLPPDPKQTPVLCKQCLSTLSVDLVPTMLLRHHRVQIEP